MKLSAFLLFAFAANSAFAAADQLAIGRQAIQSMGGCYLVDYNYTETESLKDGYERDKRVYNANSDKSVKEWIYVDEISPERLRVQHVLFLEDLKGKLMEGTLMKHTGDEWRFNAPFQYQLTSPNHWQVNQDTKGLWTRRVTNLDDGLRYACAAAFTEDKFPSWGCEAYAPIPGRETRDMGRKDYNTLARYTRITAYNGPWLERQYNTKIIAKDGQLTPFVKEEARNWYARLPDSECSEAQAYVKQRKPFWDLTREVWDEVLDGSGNFAEQGYNPNGPTRYRGFLELDWKYKDQNLSDPKVREAAKQEFRELIEKFRVR